MDKFYTILIYASIRNNRKFVLDYATSGVLRLVRKQQNGENMILSWGFIGGAVIVIAGVVYKIIEQFGQMILEAVRGVTQHEYINEQL